MGVLLADITVDSLDLGEWSAEKRSLLESYVVFTPGPVRLKDLASVVEDGASSRPVTSRPLSRINQK